MMLLATTDKGSHYHKRTLVAVITSSPDTSATIPAS